MIKVLQIQLSIIFAIFIRDMNRKYGEFTLGTFWVLLEPSLMIGFFMVIRGFRGIGIGFAEPAVFILASFLPYRIFFDKVLTECSKAQKQIRPYRFYAEIKIFDILLVKLTNNFFIGLMVWGILAIVLFWGFAINAVPVYIIETLLILVSLSLFGFGVGTIMLCVSDMAKEIPKIFDIITLPLMILSAVMFPMTAVPEPYRTYLAYNPLVHAMEFIREFWFESYISPVASYTYYLGWVMVSLFLAMILYRRKWKRLFVQ